MSYSAMWKVYRTKAKQFEQFQNSHGSAPPVWGWIGVNFLDWENEFMYGTGKDMRPLWQSYKNLSIPTHIRFALLATFDDGIVKPENLDEAARLAELTHATILFPNHVNHWQLISEAYKNATKFKDKRLQGIALGCTSVNDPWWQREQREPFSIFDYLEETK